MFHIQLSLHRGRQTRHSAHKPQASAVSMSGSMHEKPTRKTSRCKAFKTCLLFRILLDHFFITHVSKKDRKLMVFKYACLTSRHQCLQAFEAVKRRLDPNARTPRARSYIVQTPPVPAKTVWSPSSFTPVSRRGDGF